MNRTPLIIALAIAALVGLVFGLYPSLDLAVARFFYDATDASGAHFAWKSIPALTVAHRVVLYAGFAIPVAALAVLAIKLLRPRRSMAIAPRAIIFLLVTMLLGPGLIVNEALKNHWGRPRPVEVVPFGGDYRFVPWWDSRGECPKNCSFVSGDVSTVAWLLAPAALVPPAWRALAYAGALTLTAFMAIVRMIAGGHFASDTFFATAFTYLLIWLAYAAIYRWPATRLDDARIEAALESFSRRWRGRIAALFGRANRDGKP